MKRLLRKILFVKRNLYLYPYSENNLENDLDRIGDTSLFDFNTRLRFKRINEDQFELWDKWSYGLRVKSFRYNKNAYFIGNKVKQDNHVYIEALIHPHPGTTFTLYLGTLMLFILLIFREHPVFTLSTYWPELFMVFFLSLFWSLQWFYRSRLEKQVEKELRLELIKVLP